MAAQFELSLDNLDAVLAAADLTLANVVRLNLYTTDIDELFKNNAVIVERFAGSRYATSVLGVAQLPARSWSCWRQLQLTDGGAVYESLRERPASCAPVLKSLEARSPLSGALRLAGSTALPERGGRNVLACTPVSC